MPMDSIPRPGQSFPLSSIRTLTVGFGIAPNLLTLPALSSGQALAGFDGLERPSLPPVGTFTPP